MERVMERHYDFDLTYITERIISVFFLPHLAEPRYRGNLQEVAAMLKSKHQDKFLLLNLSEKRRDITRLNPKVQDYGWPDLHAPPLDRICAVCKAMDTWLTAHPSNVVVLHCKGNKGKTGVIVAAYMHYSKITAGADQALTTLAMRHFCEDKVSSSLQPAQNRYIYYFGGLLSGSIKMNSGPLFLHQVLIPSLPNFHTGGGYYPFLKIYQSLQLVYTSGIYDPQDSRARKLCVTMEPALLLKGDILVKCYHRRPRSSEREVVFRVQFHTCTVHGAQLWFGKGELDQACTDDRFPPDATVEFAFSNGPDQMKGREYHRNDPSVKVDFNTADPVVRWDSYENFNLHHQDSTEDISHTRGPLDGSLYAQVKKRRGPGSAASGTSLNGCPPGSPTVQPPAQPQPQPQGQPLSLSSDSGHSSAPSEHLPEATHSPSSPQRTATDCVLRRGEREEGRARDRSRGNGRERDRETAILDDGDPSSPDGARKQERPCGGGGGQRCGEGGWGKEREPCLANGCSGTKNNPKSRTLPALPSKPPSPTLHSPQMELCHRHSAHPLPELPWERPPPPLPCLHRPCYPCPAPSHAHPHSHTLPASNRLFCGGEPCPLLHYPSHVTSPRLSHQSLPSSPYREMFFSPPTAPPGCPCRDCTSRRAHQSAAARAFRPLRPDQPDMHWVCDAAARQTRDPGPPPWEAEREAEFWQRRSGMMPYRVCSSPLGPGPGLEPPGYILVASPQSLVDVRDGGSSGYHTPPQPRLSCPCTPHQASPAESHESRGYASGYQSGSVSPLPSQGPTSDSQQSHTCVASGSVPSSVENSSSQSSVGKALPVERRSLGLAEDSDADYTTLSSSPTHNDDRCERGKEGKVIEDTALKVNSNPSHGSTACVEVIADASNTTLETQTHTHTSTETDHQTNVPSKESTLPANQPLSINEPPKEKNHEIKAPGSAEGASLSETSTQTVVIIPSSIQPTSSVQMQLNGSTLPSETQPADSGAASPRSPIGSPERRSSPQPSSLATDPAGPKPDRDSTADAKPPSPVPDGYHTPTFPMASYWYPLLNVPHVPYSGYTAVTIPAAQPPLPEKRRLSSQPGSPSGPNPMVRSSMGQLGPQSPSSPLHVTFSPVAGELPQGVRRGLAPIADREDTAFADNRVNAKFVQDSSKYWYKPGISRDQAIAVLKDKEPGSFLIRDSNSFQGAYGLALKVVTPPPNANNALGKGDPLEQLVRHFLIETGSRGVKIKGCQNESYFGSLSALVYQHSITPISLPCALHIPEKDLVGELQETQSAKNTSTAADLLKQGAACNVLYLNSVETESLTGPQAISKATKCTLTQSPRPMATVVHFKVSAQGITLTDSQRRLFFRRHYPISSVTFSSVDPQDQRMFGFVARRTSSSTENVCHLFAEMDPEQPAVAIVNFINKVMLGPQLRR
ncbi:tensin-2-like [Aplochiton taeniatus]